MSFRRIVVVAPNWLGDAVLALPAVGRIRAAWPEAVLVAAGRGATVPLFSMVPGVDEVVRLDSRGGIVGAISWAEDAATLRSARADLAILLPNSFRSAWTAHRAGIPQRWGYAADLRGRLLTRAIPRMRGRYHMADYYLHLAENLLDQAGVGRSFAFAPATGETPVRPKGQTAAVLPRIVAPADAEARARKLLADAGVQDAPLLVGLAPGAAYGAAKQWPPEHFADLAVDLHVRLGGTCLLFGAPPDRPVSGTLSLIVAKKLQNRKNRPSAGGRPAVINLAGRTDLPTLVALMARCRSVVSNDSGAMHVAAAAGVPVTAVFGATNEHHTAPLRCNAPGAVPHEILTSPAWCRPCMLRECPIDHRCMRRVDATTVAAAVERQLAL